MAANIFKIDNAKKVNTIDEFTKLKSEKNEYNKILYMNDYLESTRDCKIKFENVLFKEVSLSKTTIKKVKFINCKFESCLFLFTVFENCVFSNCTFSNTNTSSSKWTEGTLIDPLVFEKNFTFKKDDVTIAVGLFLELLSLCKENNQSDRAKDAKYLYLKATHNMHHYHYEIKKDIGYKKFYFDSFKSYCFNKISGYGVYKIKLFNFLASYLLFVSIINYFLQGLIFKIENAVNVKTSLFETNFITSPNILELLQNIFTINGNIIKYDIFDTIYFSFVTITTIGYGDISPTTTFGQITIILQSVFGIALIYSSLDMISNDK